MSPLGSGSGLEEESQAFKNTEAACMQQSVANSNFFGGKSKAIINIKSEGRRTMNRTARTALPSPAALGEPASVDAATYNPPATTAAMRQMLAALTPALITPHCVFLSVLKRAYGDFKEHHTAAAKGLKG